jgi:hypothetical protein
MLIGGRGSSYIMLRTYYISNDYYDIDGSIVHYIGGL